MRVMECEENVSEMVVRGASQEKSVKGVGGMTRAITIPCGELTL